jgi:PAS domain S-box-containing protein
MLLRVSFITATVSFLMVLVLIYACISIMERKKYIGLWTIGLGMCLAGSVLVLLRVIDILQGDVPVLNTLRYILFLLGEYIIIWGVYVFFNRPLPKWAKFAIGVIVSLVIVGHFSPISPGIYTIPAFVFFGILYIITAAGFFSLDQFNRTLKVITGWMFAVKGINQIAYPVIGYLWVFGFWGLIIHNILGMLVAVSLLILYYRRKNDMLQDSERRFKLLAENSQNLIYYCRIVPVPELTYINPAVTDILGYTPQECYSNPKLVYNLLHPDGGQMFETVVKSADFFTKPVVCHFLRKDGRVVWLEFNNAPIYDKDKALIAVQGIATDITSYKQMQELLEKKNQENMRLLDKALESDRIKTEFLANVSHELRTPLNLILGSIQLFELYLEDTNLEKTMAQPKRLAMIMKRNCYRMLRLANNLIDVNNINAGYLKVKLHNLDIVSLVRGLTQSAAEYAKAKGVTVDFNTDIKEQIMACDPYIIERVVLNLLSNGVKFTQKGGRVTVSLSRIGDELVISVKDTGIGIAQDKLDIIFRQFYQIDSSLTRPFEGSGIGLYLVKAMVTLHKGTIDIKSQVGQGSEFTMHFSIELMDEDRQHNEASDRIQRFDSQRIIIELSDIY